MLSSELFESRPPAGALRDKRYRLAAIGDVRIEMRTVLPGSRFTAIDADLFVQAPICALVSGTAVNMARAVAPLFDATLIAKIGSDEFTDVIRASAREIDVEWRFMQDPEIPNGKIMIVRDASSEGAPGNRLLISGTPAPSLLMSASDVRGQGDRIRRSELFFADCYSLLAPGSADALSAALDLAGDGNVIRCLDLVPHDLYRYVDLATLTRYLRRAEIVISSARTIAGLLFADAGTQEMDVPSLAPLIAALEILDLPVRYWFLRFGLGDMEDTVLLSPGAAPVYYKTGYAHAAERAGFGDYVAAWELRTVMDHIAGGRACLSISSMSSFSRFTRFRVESLRTEPCATGWGTRSVGRRS